MLSSQQYTNIQDGWYGVMLIHVQKKKGFYCYAAPSTLQILILPVEGVKTSPPGI